MNTPTAIPEPADFSLVLGGPLFQLYRRAHLSGDALELLKRRVLVITLFAWLPLLILSVVGGHALGGGIKIPFLYDVEAHARFLVALPALIIAELVVLNRITPLIGRFVERGIVVTEDLPAYNAAVKSALRVRNSVAVEVSLLVLVYTLGHWIWRNQIAMKGATWYASPDATHLHLTLAGYWFAFVSIPIFQFILLRWYLRLVIWFRFSVAGFETEPASYARPSGSSRRDWVPGQEFLRIRADSFCSGRIGGGIDRQPGPV